MIARPYPSDSYALIDYAWYVVVADLGDIVKLRPESPKTAQGFTVPDYWIEDVAMGRHRKTAADKKAEAAAKVTDGLLEAVQFCAPGFKEDGETYSTHAMIYGGWITTYNGIVMYGCKLDTQMQAMPHYGRLLSALKATTGDGVQITQLSQDKISVKGKGFKTVVPCLTDYSLVHRTPADPPCGMIDSRMREGFEIMKSIAKKSGETIMQSAVLIRNGDMVACDRHVLAMFWHGIGFPDVAVPADFIEAVLRVTKSMVSFGYTPGQSLTFYFEDESFIRTQLYAEEYPDVSRAMPASWEGMTDIPSDLFPALKKIQPFIDKNYRAVYVNDGELSSEADDSDTNGTSVEVAGITALDIGLDCDRLIKLDGRITHWKPDHKHTIFQGPNLRGVLCNFLLDDTDSKGPPDPGYDAATFAHTEANGLDAPQIAQSYGFPQDASPQTVAEGFSQMIAQHDAAVQAGTYNPQGFQAPEPVHAPDGDGEPVDEPQSPAENGGFAAPQWTMPS